VAVGRETGIEILNIGTGKKIRDYARGEQDEVRVGSYRKDGRTIACVIGADKAGIIDAESGRVLRSRTVKAGLDYLVFAPDGQHVAQFGDDSTSIYLLDLTNDETPITLNGHTHQVRDLAFDGEGRVLVSVDHNGAFIVWDTTDGRVLHTFSAGAISALAVNSDGSTVATAEEDHTLTVRNAATGRLISAQRRPDVRIVKLAFSPDGKRIVSIDGHGVAKVWDTTADPPVRSLKTADPWIGSMCFSPDGRRLATVEGRHVTRSQVEVVVRIWDVAAGHEIHSLHGYSEEIFSNVAFHPDGNRVALSMGPARDDHRVHIWDLAAGRATLAFPDKEAAQHSDFTYAVAFHAHGDALATTDAILGLLTLWNIPSGRERFTAKAAVGAILDVAFSPDGRWIATAGNREAVLWDVITGREVVRLRGPEDWVSAVAFNPDGRQIAIASSDRTIWVYEAATGRRLLTLFGHEDRVTDVAYSPDGRRIASTANDRMVKLWEASTGREILSIREAGHKVVFSPDGNLMATVDEGGVKL
jgi:WD40 repeat protein